MRYSKTLIIVLCWTLMTTLIVTCTNPTDSHTNPYQQHQIDWPSLADAPWPMARHDPQGTGRSQYIGPTDGDIFLNYNDDFYMDGSIAIGAQNDLYFIENKDSCYLVKTSELGEMIWKTGLGLGHSLCTPTLASNDLVYTSFVSPYGSEVVAINMDNGNRVWSY